VGYIAEVASAEVCTIFTTCTQTDITLAGQLATVKFSLNALKAIAVWVGTTFLAIAVTAHGWLVAGLR
jgi:hypothetical protein